MNRRDATLSLMVLASLQAPARSQLTPSLYRIGILSLAVPRSRFVMLFTALRELGYEEGRNVAIDYRFAEGREDRLAGMATDLAASKVDLIVAVSNSETQAAKRATSSIPIVMLFAVAPVETGLVPSLARPDGNVTGTTLQGPETAGKILEVLRDTLPRARRVIYIWEPDFPGMEFYRRATERAGASMGLQLLGLPIRTIDDLDDAFARVARDRPDALYVVPTGPIFAHRARVIEFAARQRLPAIYTTSTVVPEGALIGYSADHDALARRAASIVDRIRKGAKPAELPIEQPTKFELAVNLTTAKALGLTIPRSILLRADRVIE